MTFSTKIQCFLKVCVAVCFSALLFACGGSGDAASTPTSAAVEFSAMGVKGIVSGQNVTIDLSGTANCATSIENMAIGVQASGASISPDPSVPRDYSKPVQFTLTTPDGSKAMYTVTVKGADCIQTPPVTAAGKYTGDWKSACIVNGASSLRGVYTAIPTSATTFNLTSTNTSYSDTACSVVNGSPVVQSSQSTIVGTKTIAGGLSVDKVTFDLNGSTNKRIVYTNGSFFQFGKSPPFDADGFPNQLVMDKYFK